MALREMIHILDRIVMQEHALLQEDVELDFSDMYALGDTVRLVIPHGPQRPIVLMTVGSDDVEESDWVLKADPETLSMSDAEGFISRIAARRDTWTFKRQTLMNE